MSTANSLPLEQAVTALNTLTFQELCDLIDMLRLNLKEAPLSIINQQRQQEGRGKLEDIGATIKQSRMLQAVLEASQPARLSEAERRIILQIATTLQGTLDPNLVKLPRIKGSDPALQRPAGYLEAKRIIRTINTDPTVPYRKPYGPYLYLRYWAVEPDEEGHPRRVLKNAYLGHKRLAAHYTSLPKGSRAKRELTLQILAAHHRGELDRLEELITEAKHAAEPSSAGPPAAHSGPA